MLLPFDLQQETALRLRLVGALILKGMQDPKTPFFERFRLARQLRQVHAALEVVNQAGA